MFGNPTVLGWMLGMDIGPSQFNLWNALRENRSE